MSAISLKSITGITSITTPAGVDNQLTLHNNNTTEAVKLDIAGNVHINNHLDVTGVSTSTTLHVAANNTTVGVAITQSGSGDILKLYDGTSEVFTVANQDDGVGAVTISSPKPRIVFNETNGSPDYQIRMNGGIFTIYDSTNDIGRISISPTRTDINNPVLINNDILYIGDKLVHWTDDDTAIRFPSANTISMETAGSERFRISSDGNAGLGTNSLVGNAANVYLTVNGSNLGGIALKANGTTQGYLQGTSSLIRLASDGSKPITFDTNGGERLRITNNGLKVGTTVDNNYAVIHAHSSGTAARLHLTNANTGTTTSDGAIIMIDSSSNMEILNKENTNLEFFTNSIERLRIDNNGKFLFGVTSARSGFFNTAAQFNPHFQIEGAGDADDPGRVTSIIYNSTTTAGPTLLFGKTNTGSVGGTGAVGNHHSLGLITFQGMVGGQFTQGATIGASVSGTPGDNDLPTHLSFGTCEDGAASASERMRITHEGKFSLGNINATPSAAFHLDWDTNNMLMLDNNSASTQKIQFANNASVHAQIFGTSASGGLTFDSDPSNNHNNSFLNFVIDGSTKAYINSSGQMGLGIVSPQANAKLQVVGRVGATEFYTTTTSTPQTDFTSSVSSNKAGLLLHRQSETNGDYGGLEFHNHPSSITSYRKGGIYYQTNGTGFGRGDIVFANDNAGDSGLVTPADHKFRIKNDGSLRAFTNSNAVSCFSNHEHGNVDFNHRGGRVLHSNGTGWDGNAIADGTDPILVLAVEDRAGNSDIGDAYGLCLHSESQDDNDYGPMIGWSNRSNSGAYNTTYAAIVGQKTGQSVDSNWSAGALHFFTAKPNSGASGYMTNEADMTITPHGYVTKSRHPAFFATHTGTDGSTSNGDLIQLTSTRHNQGDCYSTSNYYFTAPVAGVYHFTGQVWSKNGSNHARWQFSYYNGSSWSSITQHGFHGNSVNKNDFMQNASITYYMNSGDRMGMRVDNATLSYYRGGGGAAHTYFCGHLVG